MVNPPAQYGPDHLLITRLLDFAVSDLAENLSASRATWLRMLSGVFGLLLIAVTWKLWTPQTVFPQIPLLQVAGRLPTAADWIGLCTMVASLLYTSMRPQRRERTTAAVFSLALLLMWLLDQHRLQPWAYHLVLVLLLLTTSQARKGMAMVRLLTVSIYFFSAVSKLDYLFLHTLGQQFLRVLTGSVGLRTDGPLSVYAAMGFPLSELTIAMGLLVPRWRIAAAGAGVMLHLVLLCILGPWGLGHHWGVLVWNCYFVALLIALYLPLPRGGRGHAGARASRNEATRQHVLMDPASPEALSSSYHTTSGRSTGRPLSPTNSRQSRLAWNADSANSRGRGDKSIWPFHLCGRTRTPRRVDVWSRALRVIGLIVVLSPLLEPWGLIDHWPAWQLYAPRNSRVSMDVFRDATNRLLPELSPFLGPAPANALLVNLDLDRWSLHALSVPIYPQDRFQLGVALAVAEHAGLGGSLLVTQQSVSDRWTGKRHETKLRSVKQIREQAEHFWLNALPRREPASTTRTLRRAEAADRN